MRTYYDPPEGWRFGFPKRYLPTEGETLAQTLLRDGYPQTHIDYGLDEHVRFWEVEDGTHSQCDCPSLEAEVLRKTPDTNG